MRRSARPAVRQPATCEISCGALGRLRLAGIDPAEGRRARRTAPGVYLCHLVHTSYVGSWADISNVSQPPPPLAGCVARICCSRP